MKQDVPGDHLARNERSPCPESVITIPEQAITFDRNQRSAWAGILSICGWPPRTPARCGALSLCRSNGRACESLLRESSVGVGGKTTSRVFNGLPKTALTGSTISLTPG